MARENLHEKVLAELGRSIVVRERPAGTILRMDTLEAEFDVSRSVMREVVRVLTSMRLVTSRRSVGITVAESEQWNPFDPQVIRWRLSGPDRMSQLQSLGELRGGIEPVAAELAAMRATPEQCGQLTRAVVGMSVAVRAGDFESFLENDILFHHTLTLASGNEMFSGLSSMVAEVLRGRAEHHLMPDPPERSAVDLHVDVATAVQSGDPEKARAAMAAILEGTRRSLLNVAPVHEEARQVMSTTTSSDGAPND